MGEMVVNTHNEWDPLEEIIVGIVDDHYPLLFLASMGLSLQQFQPASVYLGFIPRAGCKKTIE